MASLMRILNKLLPFATPGTPLIQDLIHLGVICVVLYYAPQIQEYLQQRREHEAVAEEPHRARGLGEDTGDSVIQQPAHDEEEEENFEEGAEEINDAPGGVDFQAFQRDQINEANEAGPANVAAGNMPAQRNVGAKKAKSLARRDQRRAYHEFQRAQGEAQRARDAEGASEREAAQAAEKERRKAVEAELETKKAKEREKKREQERKEREEEQSRRERVVAIVRRDLEQRRMCNLFDVVKEVGGADIDEVWVERILNASGMLGKKADGNLTMVTATGWIVKVTSDDMRLAYRTAVEDGIGDDKGRIGYEELGGVLEHVLRNGDAVTAH